MKNLSLLILISSCLCVPTVAQEKQTDSPSRSSQVSSSTATSGSTSGASSGGNSASAANTVQGNTSPTGEADLRQSKRRQFSPLKPLRTQTGSIPGFMQRAATRMSQSSRQSTSRGPDVARSNARGGATGFGGQGSNSQAASLTRGQQAVSRGRNLTQAGNRQSLQQTFLNNALMFDENADNQLAANELRNLFLLLVSGNNQVIENNYFGFNNGFGFGFGNGTRIVGGVRYDSSSQSRTNQGFNQRQAGQSIVGAQAPVIPLLLAGGVPNVDSSSFQEAILLFLLLTLQFDNNGDGALNRAEIQQFATALLNNELDLSQAAPIR